MKRLVFSFVLVVSLIFGMGTAFAQEDEYPPSFVGTWEFDGSVVFDFYTVSVLHLGGGQYVGVGTIYIGSDRTQFWSVIGTCVSIRTVVENIRGIACNYSMGQFLIEINHRPDNTDARIEYSVGLLDSVTEPSLQGSILVSGYLTPGSL